MNIENFSTTNLPGLADLGDTKNQASIKGDDPGPKGSRVLSIEGDYGLSRLIKSYIDSELDVIYTYLTINGFNVYATILGPSGELFVEKAPIKGKEDLIHRNRKK